MRIAIPLLPFFAKWILRCYLPPWLLVMCKGYDGDDENFTELVTEDDWDLDFYDRDWYPEFQLWVNIDYLKPRIRKLSK